MLQLKSGDHRPTSALFVLAASYLGVAMVLWYSVFATSRLREMAIRAAVRRRSAATVTGATKAIRGREGEKKEEEEKRGLTV